MSRAGAALASADRPRSSGALRRCGWRSAAFALWLGSIGCSSCGASERGPAELALRVELSGCAAVRRGPVCELSASRRELALWIQAAEGPVEVTFAGRPLAVDASAAAGGTRVQVALPAPRPADAGPSPAAELKVAASRGGARGVFLLRVEEVEAEPALERVSALRRDGRIEEAERVMPATETFPEPLRGRALGLSARLALASGRIDEAIQRLTRAIELHRADGRASDEALDGMALAHTLLVHRRRISEAREALERIGPALDAWDEGRAQIGYYRALVARDAGDLRTALRELRESDRLSERLGLRAFQRRTREVSARLLQTLGEHDQAVATLRAVEAELPPGAPPCERAEVMTNRGWVELVLSGATAPATLAGRARPRDRDRLVRGRPRSAEARAEGSTSASEPIGREALSRYLASAVEAWERGCPKPAEVANARTNAALAAVEMGDVPRASAQVRAARALGKLPAFVSEWLLDVEARIALRRGDPRRAVALYEELAARGAAAGSAEVRWRATVGRGVALEAARDVVAAEASYREAEALLDEQSAHVPLNDGRAGFLADRDRSARLLVDLLLRRGDAAAALSAVRTARARAIRAAQRLDRVAGLGPAAKRRWEAGISRYAALREAFEAESAADWAVPKDRLDAARAAQREREARARAALDEAFAALAEAKRAPEDHAPPRQGELLLAFQASDDGERIHVFAQTPAAVRGISLEALPADAPDDQLAELILSPLEPELAGARKVRVLSYGPLAAVDLHALPWHGQPLLSRVAVEYPADLPVPGAGAADAAATAGRPRAVVVADTRRDLPRSHGELSAVVRALSGAWDARGLQGEAASRSAVTAALSGAALFHFASHATFDGRHGWDSALELSEGAYLRAGDVLALPSAPAVVVLSGCETGKTAASRVADMSLAHAFIAAGARIVIAATRPVEDRLAAALVARTYEGAAPGWDIGESFRAAQVEASRAMPDTDWRAYRIITR